MTATTATTDTDFENDVLKADTPVLVDFWAEWCGPCKAIGPALEEIAGEMAGRVKIVKLNIDENQAIPQQFGVHSIPTLLIFKDGELKAQKLGAMTKSKLSEWIEESLRAS